jgi:hypothetical protein
MVGETGIEIVYVLEEMALLRYPVAVEMAFSVAVTKMLTAEHTGLLGVGVVPSMVQ